MRDFSTICFLSFVVLCLVNPAVGQESKAKPKQSADSTSRVATDIEGEQEVLDFVALHNEKLVGLLQYLKDKRSTEFRQAMREMTRTKTRLENLAKRDPELHKIELELWKIRSEERLVAAAVAAAASKKRPVLEDRLRELVRQEIAKSLERLALQRDRAREQLAQYEMQLKKQEAAKEQQLEKMMKQWSNKIAKQSPRAKKKKSDLAQP